LIVGNYNFNHDFSLSLDQGLLPQSGPIFHNAATLSIFSGISIPGSHRWQLFMALKFLVPAILRSWILLDKKFRKISRIPAFIFNMN
jgi:hypothetical protein